MPDNLIERQIELEKKMTQLSVTGYRRELNKAKQNNTFGCTSIAVKLLSRILDDFSMSIKTYLNDYSKGKAVRSTLAAEVIADLKDINGIAFIASKVILNSIYSQIPVQTIYRAIGQALEDEFKMREFKEENTHYYKSIQEDLNKRGAKAQRKKYITSNVFGKRLDFHLERRSVTEKVQTGMVLTYLFVETTGLVEFIDYYQKKKHKKFLAPTKEFMTWIENTNEKLEVMQPFFLPMVCPPKDWTSPLEGGYISPYLKRNKLIKNNDRDYLKTLKTIKMPIVYKAINHIQNTEWQINNKILDTVKALWEEGKAIAELPDREDEPFIPYPYPEKNTKCDSFTQEETEEIKKWKLATYLTHKRNVQKRSIRLLVSQIIRIAEQFKGYEQIYFPYQTDFRGRLYPIPVLLQPQGSDLAKGLLQFARGKPTDEKSIKWLEIHGANMYGYDKESYEKRIEWIKGRCNEIKQYAENPLLNRGWAEADKPFQFLAFCFEYNDYLNNPDDFETYIPVQLDGTCNGLQHYSALLRDYEGGRATNLINSDKPNDIYGEVAKKLEEKLNGLLVKTDTDDNSIHNVSYNTGLACKWLVLGINRKLTKRPVMVLPYGGSLLSCREYIGEYLKDNYSLDFLYENFKIGDNPADCSFKISVWLSKYLWEAIHEILKAAITGMDYLKKIARLFTERNRYIEWTTPAGLLVRQGYKSRKKKEIKTELYGNILKTRINIDDDRFDNQRQLNGICPNFIHSLDAACLMLYILKCKKAGITSIMAVHDCYGTLAPDTDKSARFLREAFVEIYREPVLENFTKDVTADIEIDEEEFPETPEGGSLDIEEVLESEYFFN